MKKAEECETATLGNSTPVGGTWDGLASGIEPTSPPSVVGIVVETDEIVNRKEISSFIPS